MVNIQKIYREFRVNARCYDVNFTDTAWQRYVSAICEDAILEENTLDEFKQRFPELNSGFSTELEEAIKEGVPEFNKDLETKGTLLLDEQRVRVYSTITQVKVKMGTDPVRQIVNEEVDQYATTIDNNVGRRLRAVTEELWDEFFRKNPDSEERLWDDYLDALCEGESAVLGLRESSELSTKMAYEGEFLGQRERFFVRLKGIDREILSPKRNVGPADKIRANTFQHYLKTRAMKLKPVDEETMDAICDATSNDMLYVFKVSIYDEGTGRNKTSEQYEIRLIGQEGDTIAQPETFNDLDGIAQITRSYVKENGKTTLAYGAPEDATDEAVMKEEKVKFPQLRIKEKQDFEDLLQRNGVKVTKTGKYLQVDYDR